MSKLLTPAEMTRMSAEVQRFRGRVDQRMLVFSRNRNVNWPGLIEYFQHSMRNALSSWEQADVAHLMDAWTDLARELVTVSHKADAAVSEAIAATSATHAARIGFAARATWLVCTTAVPPPFGALIGAVVRGVCGEESWDKVVDRTYEWVMQAPFPHASNDASAKPNLHVITSGELTRSARIQYIGGHPALRELKDFNQVLSRVGMIFSPSASSQISAWEKKYLVANLRKLRQPSKESGGAIADKVHFECRDKAKALVAAVQQALSSYTDDRATAESVICAANSLRDNSAERNQNWGIHARVGVRSQLSEEKQIENDITQTLNAFMATLAKELVQSLRGNLRAQPVALLDRKKAQREFERAFIARYLQEQIVPPESAPASSAQGDPNHYANTVGTVPKRLISSHFEAKMVDLGIVKRYGLNIVRGEGESYRGEVYQTAARAWFPPFSSNFMPVPFQQGELDDRAARGRLAAWAIDFVNRVPIDEVFRAVYDSAAV